MTDPDPLSTRYLQSSLHNSPNPKAKHPRKPLPWSRSKLYRAQNQFGSYEDLWLDRGYHFPKLKTDTDRIKKTNNMTPTRPNSFKPAFVSYLRAMDKYRFVSGYACDYCEERKRQWVKDGREEFVRGEMREGREVVREGENYWEVEEEDEEEGEEFGLKDLPLPEGAFIVRVKEGKKKGGRLRAVKSMDEMSVSVGSSWGIVENAEFEGGGCLHHHHRPVEEEEGETSSDAGVVMTPTTESDMEQWEFMERE